MSYPENDESAADRPSYTLHPLRGVVWAAFWGTPLAAGIVMAINYSRSGNKPGARKAAVIGILATVALFAVIFAIPEGVLDNIPDSVFYLPQLFVVYIVAKSLQSELIASHTANGGAVASAWPSVGIGVLCFPFVLGSLLGVFLLLDSTFRPVVTFGNDEVYYTGDATEADARRLADVLREIEFFGADGASVQIESSSGQYTVSFMLVDDAWDDAETVDAFRGIGHLLAESGFSTPLKINLSDQYFTVQQSFTIEPG